VRRVCAARTCVAQDTAWVKARARGAHEHIPKTRRVLLRPQLQAARGLAPGGSGDAYSAPPQGGSADDLAWLDVEGAVAAFLPDALQSDAGWQVPLGSFPAPVRAMQYALLGRTS